MILSMSNQAVLFLVSALVGVFIGFVYDIFRIFRLAVKHANIFIHIEDIAYWLFASFVMFYVMLTQNYGEIRAFSILGNLIGIVLYFFTVSRFIIGTSMVIINTVKKIIKAIIKILLFPIKLILKLLSFPLNFLKIKIKNILQKSKRYVRIKSNKFKNELRIIFKKT